MIKKQENTLIPKNLKMMNCKSLLIITMNFAEAAQMRMIMKMGKTKMMVALMRKKRKIVTYPKMRLTKVLEENIAYQPYNGSNSNQKIK